MNILVYDDLHVIAHLVRSALGGRHRVSLSDSADEAMRKLDTGLFDTLLIGPGGAPEEVAAHVEREWPTIPLILAGMVVDVPCEPPIFAVLRAPLRIDDLVSAIRRLEQREAADRRKLFDMPIDVVAGENRIACRVVLAGRDSLLLERLPDVASPDADLDGSSFVSLERAGELAEAAVAFADRSPRGLKYLGLRIDGESVRRLTEAHEAAAAVAFPDGSGLAEEDPLDLV